MKLLRILLFTIIALALIYCVIATFAPKSYRVERSATIAGTPTQIWPKISNLRNWEAWSPWKEQDPICVNTYESNSKMSWVGHKEKSGTGSLEIYNSKEDKKIEYNLNFVVPFESHSQGILEMEAIDANNTKLTWADYGDISFFMRPAMMMMDMDKLLGKDFERGLFKIDSLSKAAL
jgi:hypothetical protein